MKAHTKRKITFLVGFAAYFSAIWYLWDTPAVYPLKVFVVLLHEISHAMMAVATGGTIERIVLDPNQGGACYCPGGNAFLTLSAGYLGSLAWGALLISAGQMKRMVRRGGSSRPSRISFVRVRAISRIVRFGGARPWVSPRD